MIIFLYAYLASEVEIYIEKYLLKSVALQSFTPTEMTAVRQLNNSSEPESLTYEEVKYIILNRIKSIDISTIYGVIRSWLPLFYFIFMLIGWLFYKFYNDDVSWAMALNYTLSSYYKLGYSSPSDDDVLVKIFSTIFMLIGTFLFLILTVSIIREFSLQPSDIRKFHSIWIGGLVLLFVFVCSVSFSYSYNWNYMESLYFSICVMVLILIYIIIHFIID